MATLRNVQCRTRCNGRSATSPNCWRNLSAANVQLSERSAAGTASGGARLGVVQRLGVEVTQVGLTGDRVERVVTTAGDVISTRAVVVAAGYRSVELLRPL